MLFLSKRFSRDQNNVGRHFARTMTFFINCSCTIKNKNIRMKCCGSTIVEVHLPRTQKNKVFWHQSEARTAATVWNWSGKTLSPGALLAVLYFSSCHIFLRPFRLLLVPTICPWVSEDVGLAAREENISAWDCTYSKSHLCPLIKLLFCLVKLLLI